MGNTYPCFPDFVDIIDATLARINIIGSLCNDDGNVNENVEKQWIKLQNTSTARGNATTCPLFRRRF